MKLVISKLEFGINQFFVSATDLQHKNRMFRWARDNDMFNPLLLVYCDAVIVKHIEMINYWRCDYCPMQFNAY
jgi:hypothetical protein